MLNRVILIGRLTADPELRYTNSGTAVASFTLAVDRVRQGQNGERETDFINIVVWQKQAEMCAQYLRKGRLAAVDGRLQIRSYENREGQKVRVAEVVAESVRFLDRGDNSNSGGNGNGGNGNAGNSNGGNGNGGNRSGNSNQSGNGNNNHSGNSNQGGNGGNNRSGSQGGNRGNQGGGAPSRQYGDDPFGDDPFADDGGSIDISDDDLPF